MPLKRLVKLLLSEMPCSKPPKNCSSQVSSRKLKLPWHRLSKLNKKEDLSKLILMSQWMMINATIRQCTNLTKITRLSVSSQASSVALLTGSKKSKITVMMTGKTSVISLILPLLTARVTNLEQRMGEGQERSAVLLDIATAKDSLKRLTQTSTKH